VLDLDLRHYADGSRLLVAATHGRGAFRTVIQPAPGPAPGGGGVQNAIEGSPATTFALGSFHYWMEEGGFQPPFYITIDWGDNTPLDSTTGTYANGGNPGVGYTARISGRHSYVEEGSYSATAYLSGVEGGPLGFPLPPTSIDVWDASLTASPPSPPVSGTVWSPLSSQPVATFIDRNPYATTADFTTYISWGDGSASFGSVSGTGGNFTVLGDHTYENAGSFPVYVTIFDDGGSIATTSSTATITGAISALTVTVRAIEGVNTGLIPVATFTDVSPGSYNIVLNWGDGFLSSGTVLSSGPNSFVVKGSHTYAEEGTFPVLVSISRTGASAAIGEIASVSDAPLTPTGFPLNATEGVALDHVVVARFTDANVHAPLADFTARINWGNGDTTDGTIVAESAGTFAVTGSETYANLGSNTVTVLIEDVAGASAVATSTVSVDGAAPIVTGLTPITGPPTGGTQVTIRGANFSGTTAVSFSGTPATAFGLNPDGTITALAPAHAAGTVDVKVTSAFGESSVSADDRFTYTSAPPAVTAVSPSSGPLAGGTTVTITGTALGSATAVYFGTVPAESFTILTATSIKAVAPAGVAGIVDVTVWTGYGTSPTSTADRYTYLAIAPSVSAIGPATGPASGGTEVTIFGANLNGTTQVSFGSVPATEFTLFSPGMILATAPILAPGSYHLTVTTPAGISVGSTADLFAAVAAPTVTGVTSGSGPIGGGNSVSIVGANFTGATKVLFSDTPATAFTVYSANQIIATAPAAEIDGTVDVRVLTTGGLSATGSADRYTYQNAAPAVTAVSPRWGSTAGGETVSITGSNLNWVTHVYFGTQLAARFTVLSSTAITATVPAGTAGVVDITVSTWTAWTSATSSADQFTYADLPPPVVRSISPSTGPMAGGTLVTLAGHGFTAATQVFFGGVAAAFSVFSDGSITATAPPETAGTVDIRVVTPYGASLLSYFDDYTYLAAVAAVTSISPNTGLTTGGTLVNISGSDLLGAAQVLFGNVPASFTTNPDGSLTATSPIQAVGTVHVTIVTPAGSSAPSPQDQFVYTAPPVPPPTIMALSPNSGPTGGGTVVTLTGTNFSGATRVAFGTATATAYNVASDTSITATAPPGWYGGPYCDHGQRGLDRLLGRPLQLRAHTTRGHGDHAGVGPCGGRHDRDCHRHQF
jgi:hypothetical protein